MGRDLVVEGGGVLLVPMCFLKNNNMMLGTKSLEYVHLGVGSVAVVVVA